MPPRRRRKGDQEHHQLDPALEAALAAEAERLGAIEDPVLAVHAVNEIFNGLKDALLQVGEPRLLAIIELYEELGSYQRVADATELSKTRSSSSCGRRVAAACSEGASPVPEGLR